MARSNPVPRSEIEIGLRLKQAREHLLISKTAFALQLGITREKLYNYETGRTPLPWDVGYVVCHDFNVNPIWLSTGKSEPFLTFGFGMDGAGEPQGLFSAVVKALPAGLKDYCRGGGCLKPPPSDAGGEELEAFLKDQVSGWIQTVPDESQREFVAQLKQAGDSLCAKFTATLRSE